MPQWSRRRCGCSCLPPRPTDRAARPLTIITKSRACLQSRCAQRPLRAAARQQLARGRAPSLAVAAAHLGLIVARLERRLSLGRKAYVRRGAEPDAARDRNIRCGTRKALRCASRTLAVTVYRGVARRACVQSHSQDSTMSNVIT